MLKPVRGVIARVEYKVGGLVIVPSTVIMSVEKLDSKKECSIRSVECRCEELGFKAFLQPMNNTANFCTLFWNMKISGTKKECNMELTSVVYKGKGVYTATRNMTPEVQISVQVASNFKRVATNDEIILYKHNEEPEKKQEEFDVCKYQS